MHTDKEFSVAKINKMVYSLWFDYEVDYVHFYFI